MLLQLLTCIFRHFSIFDRMAARLLIIMLTVIIALISSSYTLHVEDTAGTQDLSQHDKAVGQLIVNALALLEWLAENAYKIAFAGFVYAWQPIDLSTLSIVNSDIILDGVNKLGQLIL